MINAYFNLTDIYTSSLAGNIYLVPVNGPSAYQNGIVWKSASDPFPNGTTQSIVPNTYDVVYGSYGKMFPDFTIYLPANIDGQTVNVKDYIVSGSLPTTNFTASYAITSTFAQTASYALNISPADSASYASFAVSASTANIANTASFVTTASQAISSSFSSVAAFAQSSNATTLVTASTYPITASAALNALNVVSPTKILISGSKVGIGTANPAYDLDLVGNINVGSGSFLKGVYFNGQSSITPTFNWGLNLAASSSAGYGPAGVQPVVTIYEGRVNKVCTAIGSDFINSNNDGVHYSGELAVVGFPSVTSANLNLVGGFHIVDTNNPATDNRVFIIRSKIPSGSAVNADNGGALVFENRYKPNTPDADTTFANFLGCNEYGNAFIGDGGQASDKYGLYPNAKVTVYGSPSGSYPAFQIIPFVYNSSAATFLVSASGQIGINNNTPKHWLDVGGDANIASALTVAGTQHKLASSVGGDTTSYLCNGSSTYKLGIGMTQPQFFVDVNGDFGNSNNNDGHGGYYYIGTTGNSFLNASGGFVGIGTRTPNYELDVSGDIHLTQGTIRFTNTAGDFGTITSINNGGSNAMLFNAGVNSDFVIQGPITLTNGVCFSSINDSNTNNEPIEFRSTQILYSIDGTQGTGNGYFVINSNNAGGVVGIKNTSPNYTLDVSGDINFTGTLYKGGVVYIPASSSFATTASFAKTVASASWASASNSASYSNTASYTSVSPYTTIATGSTNWITASLNGGKQFVTISTGSLYNFTCSNVPAANVSYNSTLFINNTATATSSLSFPSNWIFLGSIPQTIGAGKAGYLSLEAYGNTIVASFANQY